MDALPQGHWCRDPRGGGNRTHCRGAPQVRLAGNPQRRSNHPHHVCLCHPAGRHWRGRIRSDPPGLQRNHRYGPRDPRFEPGMFCPGTCQPGVRAVPSHGRRRHDRSIDHQHHERCSPPCQFYHVGRLHVAIHPRAESLYQPVAHCHPDGSLVHRGHLDLPVEDLCHFAIRARVGQRCHLVGHHCCRVYQSRNCHCGRNCFVRPGPCLGQRRPRRSRRRTQGHGDQRHANRRRQVRENPGCHFLLLHPQVRQHVSHLRRPRHGRLGL
mmetsp:Transcript_1023/g.2569  ORF Transcript_1023/g.2569 Transcript_1023/m.2569 type:complete len:267 (-) Transcript_1023:746-1546(-)